MIDGAIYARTGHSALYVALTVLEEALEMSGTVLCIRAFSDMLCEAAPRLFAAPREPATLPAATVPIAVGRAVA